MNEQVSFTLRGRNPDVLTCIANLSNDEVFTPLKVGKLTHGNVGQMDGYVRMYDGLFTAPDDNPTIGLILCTEKSETVARYSVLNDRKQIFASKYMLSLPTEEQLQLEIERERHLIESALEDRADE